MEREQIIKALERCKTPSANDCNGCEYDGKCLKNGEYIGCVNLLVADALSLIKELTEENERLRAQVDMWTSTAYCEKDRLNSIKADTVQKMQERLKKEFDRMHKSNFITVEVRQWIIDQIAKEMVEGKQ